MSGLIDPPFGLVSDLVRRHALDHPHRPALIDAFERTSRLDYAALDAAMDRVAAALQSAGLQAGDCIALCAQMSVPYAMVFLGALRAGVVVAPLPPGWSGEVLGRMLDDAAARIVFVDHGTAAVAAASGSTQRLMVALDDSDAGMALSTWMAGAAGQPQAVTLEPSSPFNIIYSSGTTGIPKGIVQSHGMRWSHVQRGRPYGYGPEAVSLLSTPLYSNTTLVVFFPTLANGGCVVLMPRFSVDGYLALCETYRPTHTMLVPVQYQRLMASPDFGRCDLSSFVSKFCTSAPFPATLKAQVLQRWPGGLTEFYGMTEGGGTCILDAHRHPDKLHTVGRPMAGSDIRLIDDDGQELGPGQTGEIVGRSAGMMNGYHGRPELTRAVEWFDATGKRFIRTGDVGRFDDDRFLVLLDRKKDVIISGGFNIYARDLEEVLHRHADVLDAAVVGVPSSWGESPAAFVVLREGVRAGAEELRAWANERLGKTQRLVEVRLVPSLPRNAMGKVLKRELATAYRSTGAADGGHLPELSSGSPVV